MPSSFESGQAGAFGRAMGARGLGHPGLTSKKSKALWRRQGRRRRRRRRNTRTHAFAVVVRSST
eukprot:7923927-Pyramimonas_sp.AAC.1